MKFIKLGLISLIFFGLILTAMSLLLPSSINISRAIDINTPVDSVYNYINDLNNWKKWYVVNSTDRISLSQQQSGKGAAVSIGKVKVKITECLPDKIKADWITKHEILPGEFNFISSANAAQTTLQWHFIYKVKRYPWEKFASIVASKTIGGAMEKSLDKLKVVVEGE